MRVLCGLSLILFLLSCGGKNDARLLFREGNKHMDSNDYKGAFELFAQSSKADEHFDSAWYAMGVAKQSLAEFREAADYYRRATEVNPRFAPAWNNLGLVSGILGNVEEELRDYNEAISVDSTYHKAWYNRGNYELDRQQFEKAISDYTRAIAHFPKYIQAYFNRAEAFSDIRNYTSAVADYNSFMELNGEDAETLFLRGNCRYNLNDPDNACKDWGKAAGMDYRKAKDALAKYCK